MVALYPPVCGSRFISSRPPPSTKTITKDIPHPVSSSSARKHKVDLRPGPVKPPKSQSESHAAPQPPLSTHPAPEPAPTTSQTVSDASTSTSASTQSGSVIQTAKEDYDDASQHGILAPPPENASWAGRLWHQAKELFVRSFILPSRAFMMNPRCRNSTGTA